MKISRDNNSFIEIGDKLIEEIARIASGEVTEVSIQYAKELINKL